MYFNLTFLFALKPSGWKLVSNYPRVLVSRGIFDLVWLGGSLWRKGYQGTIYLGTMGRGPTELRKLQIVTQWLNTPTEMLNSSIFCNYTICDANFTILGFLPHLLLNPWSLRSGYCLQSWRVSIRVNCGYEASEGESYVY